MEISYTYLRSKEVVNLTDGKRLGRVCDVVFRYPENVFLGIVVPGNKGFSFKKGDVFIDVKCISCIGEDVILVRAEGLRRAGKNRGKAPQGTPSARQGCRACRERGRPAASRRLCIRPRRRMRPRRGGTEEDRSTNTNKKKTVSRFVRKVRGLRGGNAGLCGKCAVYSEETRGCAE